MTSRFYCLFENKAPVSVNLLQQTYQAMDQRLTLDTE